MDKYKIMLVFAAIVIFLLILSLCYLLYLRSEDKRMLAVKDMRIALLKGNKEEKGKKITDDFSQLPSVNTYDTLHSKF